MNQNEVLRMMAGFAILIGMALGYWVSFYGYIFVVFVGVNLLQSAFTRWCPAMWILDKVGVRSCSCSQKERGKL